MQQGVQVTRRKFFTRLSLLAGGSIALTSVAGVLTGCGGGGGGGGLSSPTPGTSTPPTLPDLATMPPQTPAQAATSFQNQFGVQTTVGAVAGPPVADAGQSLTQVLTLGTVAIPTFTTGADGAATSVTFDEVAVSPLAANVEAAKAGNAGVTQKDLQDIIKTLTTAKEYVQLPGQRGLTLVPVIRKGDVPIKFIFKQNGKTFTTIAFRHRDGTLGFNIVLSAQPGRSELRQLPSTQDQTDRLPNNGSTVVSSITNRNPYDGHVHYQFTLSARAVFDRQTGNVTVSNAQAVANILGPFVRVIGPTVPTIKSVAAGGFSVGVKENNSDSREVESDATFEHRYTRNSRQWREDEKNKIRIRKKKRTGATGGTN